jgi:hypothetical protein
MRNLERETIQPSASLSTRDNEVLGGDSRPTGNPSVEGFTGAHAAEGIQVHPVTPTKVIEHLQEKFLASTLLTVGAGKSSAALDSFAGWLLAGFAAVLTFLLGHLDSLGKYLSAGSIRHAAYIFIGAMAAVVVEKAISVIVVGSAEASAIGREVGKATSDQRIELDLPVALRECEKAFFPPGNKLFRRSLAKMEAGDLAAYARGLTKVSQVQSVFVLIEVGFIIWAAIVLIRGIAI